MSKGGYIWIYFGFCWVVVHFLSDGGLSWMHFGWWWLVVMDGCGWWGTVVAGGIV